jgi:hypothetical protein
MQGQYTTFVRNDSDLGLTLQYEILSVQSWFLLHSIAGE